jgi:hypothetical protein
MKKNFFAAFIFMAVIAVAFPAWAQEGRIHFDVSGILDWIRGEMSIQASFDLAEAGIRLPSGRLTGEETLKEAYPRLARPSILSIRLDSNSYIRDLVERRELSLEELDAISREARSLPPSLSPDLSRMIGRYTIQLERISAFLARHRRAVEPERPLVPIPAADYTGIIIIADGQLPIHGRNSSALAEPCIFPKIWDTGMSLIYERNMLEPGLGMVRYATAESIFRPTPSGLDGELAALLGPNPFRILARGVFGTSPTDPIIDRNDALAILSSENNRRLLREGRVLFVLNQSKLRITMDE